MELEYGKILLTRAEYRPKESTATNPFRVKRWLHKSHAYRFLRSRAWLSRPPAGYFSLSGFSPRVERALNRTVLAIFFGEVGDIINARATHLTKLRGRHTRHEPRERHTREREVRMCKLSVCWPEMQNGFPASACAPQSVYMAERFSAKVSDSQTFTALERTILSMYWADCFRNSSQNTAETLVVETLSSVKQRQAIISIESLARVENTRPLLATIVLKTRSTNEYIKITKEWIKFT